MSPLHISELPLLLQPNKSSYYISIYIPTHLRFKDIQEDTIRIKNVFKKASKLLQTQGKKNSSLEALLHDTVRFHDIPKTILQKALGMAFFISEDSFYYLHLPFETAEIVTMMPHYHIKPLLSFFDSGATAFLLVLSHNFRKLTGMDLSSSWEIPLENCPENLQELSQYDVHERHIEFHTRAPAVKGNRRAALFHGQGDGERENEAEIEQYTALIAKALDHTLKDEPYPLVIAGDPILVGRFRQFATYPHLIEDFIHGSPDTFSEEELITKSWDMSQSFFKHKKDKQLQPIQEGAPLTSTQLFEILSASLQGRVQTLFVDPAKPIWGKFDPVRSHFEVNNTKNDGDDDLAEMATIFTLTHKGSVFPLDNSAQKKIPSGIAALFRY